MNNTGSPAGGDMSRSNPGESRGKAEHRGAWARVMRFGCWFVRADPEILSGCPTIDRFQMISKAVLLLAVAGIATFAWGGFFFQFWSFVALPLTVVVVVWIVMIDQMMGAARWVLTGVLASPGKKCWLNAALVFRLLIGGVTASATSYSAAMLISHSTIQDQEQRDRDSANAAKRAEGDAEKARAFQNLLGARDAEIKQATADIATINGKLDAARRVRDAASQTAADSKIAADCQLSGGPGCHRGKGPMYRAALTRQAKAADDLQRAEADMSSLAAQLADATRKRDDALKAYREHEADYLAAAKAIDRRVAAEAVPQRDDPVMSYMALQKVFAGPNGDGARFFSHLMLALLLTVEMSYVLISEYFGHASIYMARLIARTKILAAEAADDFRRKTGALFAQASDRSTFRVVPLFPKAGQ
jgi:uncharacterized protein DUF4407